MLLESTDVNFSCTRCHWPRMLALMLTSSRSHANDSDLSNWTRCFRTRSWLADSPDETKRLS